MTPPGRPPYPVGVMGEVWADLLARPHLRAFLGDEVVPEGPHRAWPIPARVAHVVPARGRVLLAGDALAATDPMTGEGIGQALATGAWAAEAVLVHGPLDADAVAARYRRRVRTELVPDDAMARFLVRALRHRRGAVAAIRLAGASGWTRRNFARWLFEDYPRAVVLTPGRWRRGQFAATGAYGSEARVRSAARP